MFAAGGIYFYLDFGTSLKLFTNHRCRGRHYARSSFVSPCVNS